jgi:hypothetical protein
MESKQRLSLSNLRQDICYGPVVCADCPAHYYADQKTQIVLFVVQFALFGLLPTASIDGLPPYMIGCVGLR